MSNFNNIINNLKRRKVFKSLAIYAGFSFILIQVCDIIFPVLLLPEWTLRFVVILVILGFPTTLLLSWTYDITPANESGNNFSDVKDDDSSSKIELSLYQDLIDRRFPHIIIFYVILSWGLVYLVSFIVKEYMLSPNLINLALFGMISLFPTIFMLAYFHGKSGLRDFKRIEKIGIPMNLLASAILLFAIFSAKELGAVTQTVKFENEEGQMTERVVPRAAFIKKLGIFFFKNELSDLDIDWMHHGFVEGLKFTLMQDLFIEEDVSVDDMGGSAFFKKLRDGGFKDGRDSPFAFKQEISKSLHQDVFLTGSYFKESNQILVKVKLYESQRGKPLSEHSYTADNIFDLIDKISNQIRFDLKLPEKHINESKFLSIRDLFTSSSDAFESQIKGQIAWNVNFDNDECMKHIERSVKLDSTNPWTRWILAENYMFSDQLDKAIEQYKGGFKYLYKFPETYAFVFKRKYYLWVEKDPDKDFKLTQMNAEMNPENKRAQQSLGYAYYYRFMLDDALIIFKELYQMYPDDHDLLDFISQIYITVGDFDNALHYTKEYMNKYPNEAESYSELASLYSHFGYSKVSLENYEKALLMDPNNIDYLGSLAETRLYAGIFEGALKICEEMFEFSTLPEHFSKAYNCLDNYYRERGEIRKSIEMIEKKLDVIKERDFVNLGKIFSMDVIAYRYISIGQFDKALEILQTIDEEIIEFLKDETIFNYINIYYELKDVKKLQDVIISMEDLIKSDPYFYHKEKLYYTKGLLNELEGNYVEAIENHRKALEFDKIALPQLLGLARCYRLNGEIKQARDYMDRALKLFPYAGETRYESALIYAENSQMDQAIKEIEKVFDIWPEADADHIKANEAKLKLAEWMK